MVHLCRSYGHVPRFNARCRELLDAHTRVLFPNWTVNQLLFDRLENCGSLAVLASALAATAAASYGSLSASMVALVLTCVPVW